MLFLDFSIALHSSFWVMLILSTVWCREMSELQYNKYTNRFGPGAVIYWFGFVEELAMEETDTLLLDSFPRDIVQLPRLELPSD